MIRGSCDLFRFIEGEDAFIYTITNSDILVQYDSGSGNETYYPVAVGRTEAQEKGDMSKQNMTITLSIDNETAQRWYLSSMDAIILVTIFNLDEDGVEVEWKGRLTSILPNVQFYELVFESVYTSMRRIGLRRKYQISCPHALYGAGCNLNKEDFAINGTVTNVNTQIITVPEADTYADGYFNSGIFEDNAGNIRFIVNHVGSQITLIRPMNALIAYVAENGYSGLTCRLFPGCNRTTQICNDRFSNLANYGGFPFIPTRNPFDGSSIV